MGQGPSSSTHLSGGSWLARGVQSARGLGWEGWVWLAALMALSWLVYHFTVRDLEPRIAWMGWSPMDYVAHKLQPENFHRDWSNGAKDHHYIWPMRSFYYLAKYFDVPPLVTIHPFMAVQGFSFVAAVAYLTLVIFPRDRLAALLASCLAMTSGLVGINMARFGEGIGFAVMNFAVSWGLALAFVLLALAMHLKGRVIACFVSLALAMYCHAGLGTFAACFVGAWYLAHPRHCLARSFLLGLGLYLLLMIPHMSTMSRAAGAAQGIPVNQWLTLTKIFSYHSYAVAMKMFSDRAYIETAPWVLFSLFSLLLLRTVPRPEHRSKLLWGFLGCLLATLAGVIFSDFYPVMAIVKMQPARASALITLIGGLCLAAYLSRLARGGDGGSLLAACLLWAIIVIAKPGMALVPFLLVLALDYWRGRDIFRGLSPALSLLAGAALICLLGLAAYLAVDNYVLPALTPGYVPSSGMAHILADGKLKNDLLLGGGAGGVPAPAMTGAAFVAVAAMLALAHRMTGKVTAARAITVLGAALILALPAMVLQHRADQWLANRGRIAGDYLQVQLWARSHTPKDSLFLTDPSHAYGWRDFSQRSSFGSGPEWGYASLFYGADPQRLAEGLRRLAFFAGDPTALPEEELANYQGVNYWSSVLAPKARARFCRLNEPDLREMSEQWGINYAVFDKDCLGYRRLRLPVAYENDHFLVYALGG